RRALLKGGHEMKAVDAARRAAANAFLERHQHRRPVKALHHPRSDDADHSGMPGLRMEDQRLGIGAVLCLLERLREDMVLYGLPLEICGVKRLGERARILQRWCAQKLEPEGRVMEAPSGVNARTQPKPHLAAADRSKRGHAGNFLQGADSGSLAASY